MKMVMVVVCLVACLQIDARGESARFGLKPFFGGIVDLVPGGNHLDDLIGNPNLDKPWVDGFRWREQWNVVQPDSLDVYDWSNTDAAIDTVAAKGKKLTLSVAAGVSSSPGIYLGKRPCIPFPCDTDGDGINDSEMPFPDRNYLAKWDAFVYAMGARYDRDPNVALVFVSGIGQQVVEFHVTNTVKNEKAWNTLAVAAGYADKSAAIQAAARHVIDTFVAAFPTTPILFTTGNPWADEGGVFDQDLVEDYVLSVDNGRAGICDSFLKATSTHSFTYPKRDYPHGEQAINATFDSRFYSDLSMPWPRQPKPMFDLLQNGAEKGDQYVEVYEYDLNGGLKGGIINDLTFITQRILLLANLP
jgi:hypothetical protein